MNASLHTHGIVKQQSQRHEAKSKSRPQSGHTFSVALPRLGLALTISLFHLAKVCGGNPPGGDLKRPSIPNKENFPWQSADLVLVSIPSTGPRSTVPVQTKSPFSSCRIHIEMTDQTTGNWQTPGNCCFSSRAHLSTLHLEPRDSQFRAII